MLVELITKNAGQTQEETGAYFPRPSSVGRCIRALVYHAIGVPADKFPDRALLVFEDGNWAEEVIKDHIRKTVFHLEEWKGKNQRIEIATINGRKMTGEIDGLITDPLGKIYLLEIKSINHFGFERLKDGPLDEHRRQTNLYLHGLLTAGIDVREALILYKNKNTAAMKEFVIKYDEDRALTDILIFESVELMAGEGDIPARPYAYDDWQCQYCRWQKHCWKNYVEEINKLESGYEMESDFADAARFYQELGAQIGELQTQRDESYKKLKDGLLAVGAKEAKAGEYIIKLVVFEQNRLVDKTLVPEAAFRKVPAERISVKRIR